MVPYRQGWLAQVMTENGFRTRDRVAILALVLVGVVNIAVNLGGVVLEQHVRNWIGWGDTAEKQVHEYTSLSKSSYEGLSRRWKQVLADVFMGGDKHLPAAVELLGWLGTEELDAIGKIAPLVLNKRAVYADDMEEIGALSGVDLKILLRLKKNGIVDETPGFMLDVWNAGTQALLMGGTVHLGVTIETGRFGLSRMTLTPAGAYIVSLLEAETNLAYLRQVAEEMEKNGAQVEMVYGEIEDFGGVWGVQPKAKLAWKGFEEIAGKESDGASQPPEAETEEATLSSRTNRDRRAAVE